MKKTSLLIVLVMIASISLTACKKKKDEEQSQTKDHLNPPAWIQYTWTKVNGMNGEDGFRFTSDDMFTVMYDAGGNQTADLSYMETIKNKDYSISEQSTADTYQFSVHYNDTNSTESWNFALNLNGELVYTDNMQNTFVYTKKN